MKKTSFLALLGKNFPEKLSGLSVKGGGYPPFPLNFFEHNDCLIRVGEEGGHNGRTVAPEAILFESPCRANSETKMAKA